MAIDKGSCISVIACVITMVNIMAVVGGCTGMGMFVWRYGGGDR
jgi:hypothetical protein